MAASVLLGAIALAAPAHAQAPTNAEAGSPAKRELAAKVLKLQQSAIESLGRQIAEQPAAQLAAPVRAAVMRLPEAKREAVARQIDADLQRYAEEVVPIVRDRAVALAPATLAPMIEQRFTEDELRQLVAFLESPIHARYQALGLEMQRALGNKVVAETRAIVEPKYKTLEQNIGARLRAVVGEGAPAAAGGGAASAPAARASGRGN